MGENYIKGTYDLCGQCGEEQLTSATKYYN